MMSAIGKDYTSTFTENVVYKNLGIHHQPIKCLYKP